MSGLATYTSMHHRLLLQFVIVQIFLILVLQDGTVLLNVQVVIFVMKTFLQIATVKLVGHTQVQIYQYCGMATILAVLWRVQLGQGGIA